MTQESSSAVDKLIEKYSSSRRYTCRGTETAGQFTPDQKMSPEKRPYNDNQMSCDEIIFKMPKLENEEKESLTLSEAITGTAECFLVKKSADEIDHLDDFPIDVDFLKNYGCADLVSRLICCVIVELCERNLCELAKVIYTCGLPNFSEKTCFGYELMMSYEDGMSISNVFSYASLADLNVAKLAISQHQCDTVYRSVRQTGDKNFWPEVVSSALNRCAVIRDPDSNPQTSTETEIKTEPPDLSKLSFRCLKLRKTPSKVIATDFMPALGSVALGMKNGWILVHDYRTEQNSPIVAGAPSCSHNYQGMELGIDLVTRTCAKPTVLKLSGHTSPVHDVKFAGDSSEYLLSCAANGAIKLFDLNLAGQIVSYLGCSTRNPPWTLDIDRTRTSRFAVGSLDGSVRVFCFDKLAPIRILSGHADSLDCLTFSKSDDSQLVSASSDRTVKLWDLRSSICTASYSELISSPTALCNSRSDYVACGDRLGNAYVWCKRTHRCIRKTDSAHIRRISDISFLQGNEKRFSNSDPVVVSSGIDGRCKLWTLNDSKTSRPDRMHFVRKVNIFSHAVDEAGSSIILLCAPK